MQQKSIFHSRFLAAGRVYSQLAKRMLRYASLDIANASTPFKVHLKKHGMEYESFYIHSNYTKKYIEGGPVLSGLTFLKELHQFILPENV